MRRKSPWAYLTLLAAILLLMSIPKQSSEKLRGYTIAALAPVWESLNDVKLFFSRIFSSTGAQLTEDSLALNSQEEILRLRIENQMLSTELNRLEELFQHEVDLNVQLGEMQEKLQTKHKISPLLMRQQLEFQNLLAIQIQALPARVIFRSPSIWHSSLWINVGEDDNKTLNTRLVAKNSPVVVGTSVVGVIDYVGKHQSRVRLITDSGLHPSVRALRGGRQDRKLNEKVSNLIEALMASQGLFENQAKKNRLIAELEDIQAKLNRNTPTWRLAKGELRGSGHPLWKNNGQILKGVGFNYDFPDEDGPARDLRSGKPLDNSSKANAMPILKVNDLLVTSGMDGVFPAGLQVAEVTKIHMLKEGDYYYELEAMPTAGNLDDLSLVFVLPPVGYDPEEQPPAIGWQ